MNGDPRVELRSLATGLRERLEGCDERDIFLAPLLAAEPPSLGVASPAEQEPRRKAAGAAIEKTPELDRLRRMVSECRKCPLGNQRLNPAFGVGSPDAAVMFVGEGPGFEEDRRGEPFVGKAGQLLDKILASIGLSRQTVYIANVVKCHPMVDPSHPDSRGNDRPPNLEEIAACRPYLAEQIRLIEPRFLVSLGAVSASALLGETIRISAIRGRWRDIRLPGLDRSWRLLPTYHPAALLRDPNLKRDVWTDMKNLKQELERAP